ncbi:hypothetical protein CBOM_03700 [Ceraceosorus bombacis]|uniref:RxLR-like protein n=1 Tax=Ceraceosorus bombacis TaxID=401625 RepID=A0A0P1BHA4_9BASI|nr:hypothetical protein CBOM_03700 [Ceraceosorus bombacis]
MKLFLSLLLGTLLLALDVSCAGSKDALSQPIDIEMSDVRRASLETKPRQQASSKGKAPAFMSDKLDSLPHEAPAFMLDRLDSLPREAPTRFDQASTSYHSDDESGSSLRRWNEHHGATASYRMDVVHTKPLRSSRASAMIDQIEELHDARVVPTRPRSFQKHALQCTHPDCRHLHPAATTHARPPPGNIAIKPSSSSGQSEMSSRVLRTFSLTGTRTSLGKSMLKWVSKG